ncbi:MAG: hypothetical protein KBH24_05240 [Brachymonas sp.]|nr:hypothetical protein [Brachymonas sp.]
MSDTDTPPAIPPFWHRLNKFFLFPMQTEALLYALLLSVCTLLILVAPLLGAIAILGVIFAAASYAFKIAATSSRGILSLSEHMPADNDPALKYLPWKFAGALFLQLMAAGFVIKQMPALAPVALLVFSLLIPATMMVLIQHTSLRAAINPASLLHCISSIGWPYLLLWLFMFLLTQGSNIAAEMLIAVIPLWLLLPGIMFVTIYFWWVNAALIGYTMYQYHQELDIDIINEYVADQTPSNNPRQQARQRDAEVASQVQQGQLPQALQQAQQWQRENPENLPDQRRYYRLLLLQGASENLLRQGHTYIELLLKKQAQSEALQTYKACIEKMPHFALQNASNTLHLAQYACKTQEYMLAIQLLRGYDKRFKGDRHIPAAYALIVRVLAQGLQQPQQALQVYQGLRRLHPNDPHTQEAALILKEHLANKPATS